MKKLTLFTAVLTLAIGVVLTPAQPALAQGGNVNLPAGHGICNADWKLPYLESNLNKQGCQKGDVVFFNGGVDYAMAICDPTDAVVFSQSLAANFCTYIGYVRQRRDK